MNAQEIREKLHATPLVPFRIHTGDGRYLDVKHPEMAWLTKMASLVAHPVKDRTHDIPYHYHSVSPLHIVQLEPLVRA
jgi:hypothetical protein